MAYSRSIKPSQSPSSFGGTALKVGLGFATGGPVGAAAALIGSKNPALGKAVGLAGGAAGQAAPAPTGAVPGVEVSTPPPGPTNAIERRYAALSQDPQSVIAGGLAALRDPGVPQEMRDAYAEPFLKAKFGRLV